MCSRHRLAQVRLAGLLLALLLLLAALLSLAGPASTAQAATPAQSLAATLSGPTAVAANSSPANWLASLPLLPIQATSTWSGAAGDGRWSNPANWAEGRSPSPTDRVRFPANAGDARVDPAFGGIIAALHLDVEAHDIVGIV